MAVVAALIFWSAVIYGHTLVLTGSKITRPLRRILKPLQDNELPPSRTNPPLVKGRIQTFFGVLAECPMCMSFWVGLFWDLVGFGPTRFFPAWITSSVIAPTIALPLLDSFAAVAVSWGIHVALCRIGAQEL